MRSGSLALKRAPETMPAVSGAVAQETHPAAEAKVVPISIANEQPQEVIRARPERVAQPLPAQQPSQLPVEAAATSLVLASDTAGAMADATMAAAAVYPVYPQEAEEPVADEAALESRSATASLQQAKKRGSGARSRWDVQLLYMLFPELDPSYRPEFQAPVVNFTKDVMQRETEKQSKKIQILSWFYPDLELDRVHLKQREHRRAPRIQEPGLVGFYFTGGHSQPHPIRNLSVMGFYMITEERWLPGTVIRVTLQIIDSPGDDPRDTLTVLSRVVNWGADGGGFEFVMPGFVD